MSEKSMVQKLLIKEGQTFLLVNAPEGFEALLEDLPKDVTVTNTPVGAADVVLSFVTSRDQLEGILPTLKGVLGPKSILWVGYPKGMSKKFKSNVNRDSIAAYAQTVGLQAVSLFAIDDDWSSLRLKVL